MGGIDNQVKVSQRTSRAKKDSSLDASSPLSTLYNFFQLNNIFGSFQNDERRKTKEGKKTMINICTKLAPFLYRIGRDSMVKAILASQKRINSNKVRASQMPEPPIEMGQLHWAPPFQWQEKAYWDGLCLAQEEGLIKEIGLSNYGPKGIKRAAAYFAAKGEKEYGDRNRYRISTLQVQFSLISRYPLTNGLLEVCRDLNIKLIGYSPLGLGFLTTNDHAKTKTSQKQSKKTAKGPRSYLLKQLQEDYLPVKRILFSS